MISLLSRVKSSEYSSIEVELRNDIGEIHVFLPVETEGSAYLSMSVLVGKDALHQATIAVWNNV